MSYAALRFLVVEDNEFQLRTLVRYLEGMGAQNVCTASEGAAALAIVQTAIPPIDIIISDVQMPGMDGMEFVRRLHEIRCRASIILASGLERRLLGSIATMTQAYGLRLLGSVEKPLTPGKLKDLVKKHRSALQDEAPGTSAQSFSVGEILDGIRADEFEPFFQPKVQIATGRVKGTEALARWRHPVHGIVSPYAFVPVLEREQRIEELTHVMLRKSAAACSAWHARGHELVMCVNLSLASLGETNLVESLLEIVSAEGLPPRYMVFEVTESAVLTQVAGALENLARMRMRGFGLSIDDYGTGYSSMQQLTRIAFTELKIDRAFVNNAANDPAARVILSSSLDMAKKLGIEAVAEGVETDDDWKLLQEIDCALAQGYLIAKPMA